jgi:uracil-DNA glycosylase family 4
MGGFTSLDELTRQLVGCRQCPRLVDWREQVARDKRAAFAGETYWGRPVPGFGDPNARLVIVGLAPAAHGANRTGRMFTGDRSGDWLYRALYEAGAANQPESTSRSDGLQLSDTWITAPVRCAPPANKPAPVERDACARWFDAELDLLPAARVFLCLGRYAYQSLWSYLGRRGTNLPRPRPRFGHGVQIDIGDGRAVALSYHPSQQNTFTGKLSRAMLGDVIARSLERAAPDPRSGP